jgi:hypothetical protein
VLMTSRLRSVRRPPTVQDSGSGGRTRGRQHLQARIWIALAAWLVVVAIPASPASAATPIGQVGTGAAPQECAETNLLQSSVDAGTPYVVPAGGGVITSWRHLGGVVAGSGKLLMWRAAGGNNFTVIGKSDLETFTSGVVREFPARIPVSGGDILGMRVVDDARNCLQGGLTPGNVVQGESSPAPEPAIGETRALTALPGFRLNVAATLEPDCDGDGLGDETQDPVLPLNEVCGKGNRTLTLDANKNKVKKRKKVTLSGRLTPAARQGPCESGQTVELQRKRPKQTTYTTFTQVQTDAGGNFSLKQKVKKTFEFRAQVVETAACTAALSNSEKVKVKKKK